MKNHVSYKIVLVTPEIARAYLAQSKGNRKISDLQVDRYAKMMSRGEWGFSPDPITFDENGVLINGHHRLFAVIAAGVPVQMSVLSGVPHATVQNTDIGKSRTMNDVVSFSLPEMSNTNVIVATARFLLGMHYRNGSLIITRGKESGVVTQKDVIAFVRRNYDDLFDAVAIAGNVSYCRIIFRATAFRLRHYDREKVAYFFARCRDGAGLDADSPILLLRNKLLSLSLHGSGAYKTALYYINKAWNLYATGEKRKVLQMPQDAEVPELLFAEKIEEMKK